MARGDAFLEEALEPSTVRLYRSHWGRFVVWCEDNEFTPETPSERTIVAFVEHLVKGLRLSLSSVSVALTALHHHFRFDPVNPINSARVKAARRAAGKVAPSPVPKKPITSVVLGRIAAKIVPLARASGKGALKWVRDWAMILLAHRSMLRRSEIVGLRNSDVIWTRFNASDPDAALWPQAMIDCDMMILRIRSSKTAPTSRKADPDSEHGTSVIVGPHVNPDLSPVRWCRRLQLLNVRDIGSGWFFPNVSGAKTDRLNQLSGATVNFAVKRAVELIGLKPSDFGAHSTRRGAATEAFRKALDIRIVKDMGRWRSDCVYAYIDDVTGNQLEFQRVMRGLNGVPSAPRLTAGSGGGAAGASTAADVDCDDDLSILDDEGGGISAV